MKDSPEILAQKLRRAVDQKKYAEQAVGHYMKQLRMAYPDLNQALDQIDQCGKVHVAFRLAVPLDCQRRHVGNRQIAAKV